MIASLTRIPTARILRELYARVKSGFLELSNRSDRGGLAIKVATGTLLLGLLLLLVGTIMDYRDALQVLRTRTGRAGLESLPSVVPIVCETLGVFLALVAFLVSLWVREKTAAGQRRGFIVISLSLAALASLAVWLPTDIIETRQAILGQAPAGETPSIPAYFGKLLIISLIILSIPASVTLYFRLGLLDRYLVHSFVAPFTFSVVSFMAIWIIGDITSNVKTLKWLSFNEVLKFYVVQMPFVILFVMPVAVLLSGLSALGKMSKSNELISMIVAGRSVLRILTPLFVMAAYTSFFALALKYEWAPTAVGYKKAISERAKRQSDAKRDGQEIQADIWSRRGWMHVNEVDHRSWFVGLVPLKLSDEMADVIVLQLDDQDQPRQMWISKRARWVWNSNPPKWVLTGVRIYTYDEEHIPRVETRDRIEITGWSETPWRVLSSSQDPEYLGIPGLTMYLNGNREMEKRSLAAFRTNWWYVFAEPASCFVLMLVAAPLGIVYSRRGGMGGVSTAIIVFALMFVMRGTFIAMGHGNRLPPFLAAWLTNIIVGSFGLAMLWYRARNREAPKWKSLFTSLFRWAPGLRRSA